ncbi:MAG: hypothetical protein ACLSX5_11770 [Lachnospiraceae bacterium]
MDKYEFNIKVEQLKKLVNKGDYDTAMKIADTIDWRRVRNANLLSLVSSVYEKNREYHEAKEILLIAFERAPIGKRLLYKLTQLALKDGDIQEAEAYYREFCSLAEDDSRQYILQYLILKAKNAPPDQLVNTLEVYTSMELDEKWLYELAEQYSQAGMERECIDTCDKIMLLFGFGKYVDKAMELKVQYAPLNNYQRDLAENRDAYEEKLKAVEQGNYYVEDPVFDNPAYEETPAEEERNQGYSQEYNQEDYQNQNYGMEEDYSREQGYGEYASQDSEYGTEEYSQQPYYEEEGYSQEQAYAETAAASEEEYPYHQTTPVYRNDVPVMPQKRIHPEEELQVQMKEAEVEEQLAQEMSRLSSDEYSQEEADDSGISNTRVLNDVRELKQDGNDIEKTRVIRNIREIQEARTAYQKEMETNSVPSRSRVEQLTQPNHLMIEADSPEIGLEIAKKALKKIHLELGTKNPAAKISGAKLNKKGLFALADKLAGKDLIIENAADLNSGLLDELNRLMAYDETGIIVVLIDTPSRLENLHNQHPALSAYFECIGSQDFQQQEMENDAEQETDTRPVRRVIPIREGDAVRPVYKEEPSEEPYLSEEKYPEDSYEEDSYAEDSYGEDSYEEDSYEEDSYEEEEDYPEETYPEEDYEEDLERETSCPGEEQNDPEEEMTIDEFAQYATQYASQIDCSISGKSMLALYERIEIMEEDNIPLTRENAENLIEEAADKAEKPSLGKMIKGVFSSKYDKDGLLILKEEHFI